MPDILTPWWEATGLRAEITEGAGTFDDVQMSLFQAVHGASGRAVPYSDPNYYGEITHPSVNLTEILAQVAVRLAGPDGRSAAVPALYWLNTGMGGGKSHGLIGLWHLAAHPVAFGRTEIGLLVSEAATLTAGGGLPEDLNCPVTVVLACDNMTAGRADPSVDGPATTLSQKFFWRLFAGDEMRYRQYEPDYASKNRIAEALSATGRPVLILIDEVMDYVRQLSDTARADLATRDMAFLKALLDAVNDVPHVAMAVVMISTEDDSMALDAAGTDRRTELVGQLERNGKTATVVSPTDFVAILRRRLFDRVPPDETVSSTAALFRGHMAGVWAARVLPGAASGPQFADEVARCYPFHPALIALAEMEWARVAGFQRVRSTIRIFAASAFVLAERGRSGQWTPGLIGVGDLPLSSAAVREALIGSGLLADERLQNNYRSLAATDVAGDDDRSGHARSLDLARDATPFTPSNPRAAERTATALYLYSLAARSQGRQGATENELRAASFVPDASYGPADADGVLAELTDPDTGLAALERIAGTGGQAARLYLSTRQTVNMLFRSARASVNEEDRDAEFANAVERLKTTGPFKVVPFVRDDCPPDRPRPLRDLLEGADLDNARKTRLVVLDPRRFSLLNGSDSETRTAIQAALGLGTRPLVVAWAASAVFAVVNTQRRNSARPAVTTYVAWVRVCQRENVLTSEQMEEAEGKRAQTKRDMEAAIKAAYQHVLYLGERINDDDTRTREMVEVRLENDSQSALSGATVWAKLVERHRALALGDLTARALLVNLDAADYEKPLDELRDSFWNLPRKPLLPEGEPDLRRAIFEAVRTGHLRLLGNDGLAREVAGEAQINLTVANVHLALPEPVEPGPVPPGPGGAGGAPEGTTGDGSRPSDPTSAHEVEFNFTLNVSLSGDNGYKALQLLTALANAVDRQDATHLRMTVAALIPGSEADVLDPLVRALGGTPTRREV